MKPPFTRDSRISRACESQTHGFVLATGNSKGTTHFCNPPRVQQTNRQILGNHRIVRLRIAQARPRPNSVVVLAVRRLDHNVLLGDGRLGVRHGGRKASGDSGAQAEAAARDARVVGEALVDVVVAHGALSRLSARKPGD